MLETLFDIIWDWILRQVFKLGKFGWTIYRMAEWKRRYVVCMAANIVSTRICTAAQDLLRRDKLDIKSAEQLLRVAEWVRKKNKPLETRTLAELQQRSAVKASCVGRTE